MSNAAVVICGAGIAGVATAFHLVVEMGTADVVLCDPRPALTLTSDKSTECYRNWWPTAEMVSLMNRSISLMEQFDARSNRAFGLNRRGYLYLTADQARLDMMIAEGAAIATSGGGELRRHQNPSAYTPNDATTDGADLLDRTMLAEHFPYVSPTAVGALHVRRAGWLSAQQLGAWMLDQALGRGLEVVAEAVSSIDVNDGQVRSVTLESGRSIHTETFVNAAGPMVGEVAGMAGIDLPVHSELHHKVAFRDSLGAVPRGAPMMIWSDPQRLEWSDEERSLLSEVGRAELAGMLPSFCHGRPEGGEDSPWVLALWEYSRINIDPTWPLPHDDLYPEVVLRGMAAMIPALGEYIHHLPQPVVDGGYYTKAPDNKPLVGPVGPLGSFVCGALSGFGVMAGAAAGELAALHVMGRGLPDYASAFHPARFEDPAYSFSNAPDDTGQL